MFFNKKIVLTDKNQRVYRVVSASAKGEELSLSAKGGEIEEYMEVFLAGKYISCGKLPVNYNIPNWQGEEFHVAIVSGAEVLATGSSLGNHNFNLFAKENIKTKEKEPTPSPTIEEKEPQPNPIERIESAPPSIESETITEEAIEEKVEEEKEEEKTEYKKENEVHEFYCSIKQNLDEMLVCYPREEKLYSLIEDSEWVKVERQGENYVVGLIKNDNAPEYVCYGVPASKDLLPPENLKKYCQWIPLSEEEGYWMIFQDAKTGIAIENKEE